MSVNRRTFFGSLVRVSVALSSLVAHQASAAPDVAALLKAADRARGGGLPGVTWTVQVAATRPGSTQARTLVVRARGDDSLVEFQEPSKVAGQKLLTRGKNLWFIRPGLQKAVPISPRQRLLGEAANGDIAATNYAGDYGGTFGRQEKLGDEDCAVLELAPVRSGVTYDRILYWVSLKTQLGMKAEFYSTSGKLFKTASFEYANSVPYQGRSTPFVSKMVITDAIEVGAVTTLRYASITISDLPASTFNLELLTH